MLTFNLFILELISSCEADIKKAVTDGVYLDYVLKDTQYYVTFMATVSENMEKVYKNYQFVSPSIHSLIHPFNSLSIFLYQSIHSFICFRLQNIFNLVYYK